MPPLVKAVALGLLTLCAAYAARPLLIRAAEVYNERSLGSPSPLRTVAGWYYLWTNHPPIFALGCAIVVPLMYLGVSAVLARRRS